MVGTVDYMAPEQVTGEPSDARTDIYALGCVFFEMLTGKVPYERETSVATLFAHVHDPPPRLESPLAEEHPEFMAVLDRAMAKQPGDRYLSAGDLARDAAAALGGTHSTGAESMVATGEARPSEATAGVPEPTVDEPQAIGAHGPVTDDPAQPPPGAADRPAEKTGAEGRSGATAGSRWDWVWSSPRRPRSSCSPTVAPRPGRGNSSKRCSARFQTTTSRVVALRPSGCAATRRRSRSTRPDYSTARLTQCTSMLR